MSRAVKPRRKFRYVLIPLGLVAAIGLATERVWHQLHRVDGRLAALARVVVMRSDLFGSVRAGGKIESVKRTLIECELENLSFNSEGRSVSAGGRSTILDLIPDGSTVHRDDILCRLDSSDYEELVRQQEIKVRQARNDFEKVELDAEAAEMALLEYREGTVPSTEEEYRGQIILAESNLKRQDERVGWTQAMIRKGYQAPAQLTTELDRRLKIKASLEDLRGNFNLFRKFRAPVTIQQLEMKLSTIRSNLDYQKMRKRRTESLLAKFQRQVELCTIRAPHDGFVIYATKQNPNEGTVEVGARVYQKMDLFYLPDLSEMEVQAVLHESIVDRIHEGMSARIRIEGLPQSEVEGHVTSISPVSMPPQWFSADVKSYLGKIRLNTSPRGLKPGMTAEVEVDSGVGHSVLVVPSESVRVEGGRDYCYVARSDGVERREITLGKSTREMLEVTNGLEEGEEVIRDPSQVEREVSDLVQDSPEVDKEPASPIAQ